MSYFSKKLSVEFLRLNSDNVSVNRESLCFGLIAGVLSFFVAHSSFGQGTAFQYQGQLGNGGAPANGNFDFQFTLYNALTNGTAESGTLTNFDVGMTNGLFTTTLDFGPGAFTGASLWLDIGVRTNGGTNFTMLLPLQPVLPVPYAIFANTASNLLGTLSGSAFAGFTNAVSLTNGANLFSGTFSGNGGLVTNVSVTNLTGVLADSQLPNNTAYLNSNQLFTANNTFNGTNTFNGPNTFTNMAGNSFSGSFFGNGLVGWIVVTGNTVQASVDHGYLLTNSQLVTVTLPASANPGDIVRIACAGAGGWQLAQNAGQSILGNFVKAGNWNPSGASAENYTSITASSDGTKMAAAFGVTGSGGIFLSSDSGQTWKNSSAITSFPWESVACSSDGTKLIGGPGGQVLYTSTNSGSTWTPSSSVSATWNGVASSASGNNFVAVGTSGIYTNLGSSWLQSFTVSGNGWSAVDASPNFTYLIAADSGTGIYTSTNSAKTWTKVNSSTFAWHSVAISTDGTRLIAAVNGGGIYVSTNSGASWGELTSIPTSASWAGIAASADCSKVAAAVSSGDIYITVNGGVTWQTNTTVATWSCLTSSFSGETFAAGINNNSSGVNGIYTLDAASQTTTTTTGTSGYISGPQCSSVELQCIGNNQFMPVNSSGVIWAN